MIFGLLYFCVVILCVNRSRTSFILYRIVKRHSRQSNVRRIWTCADNAVWFDRAALPGHFGSKPFWPGTPQPKSFVFYTETAFSGNNFDFGTSIEEKMTVSEYHNQTNVNYTLKDCEGKLKGMPGSATIKETGRKCN